MRSNPWSRRGFGRRCLAVLAVASGAGTRTWADDEADLSRDWRIPLLGWPVSERLDLDADPPPSPPRAWDDWVGEYGTDSDQSRSRLVVLERGGRLWAAVPFWWFVPIGPGEKAGRTEFDRAQVERNADGRITALRLFGTRWPRRPLDVDVFRITLTRPVAELRAIAMAAKPPAEPGDFRTPDLVDLTSLDPSIRTDIRYATTNNFMSNAFYVVARASMQRPAAEALLKAHLALAKRGFGLLIHDAYRPWHVTRMFWDGTPELYHNFVANPAQGSRHNRGCAVDLTLYDLRTGAPIEMPSLYDEFSPRAFPDYPGGTSRQRWHRDLLRRAMEEQGFRVFPDEWWHFDFRDWPKYRILNIPLEDIR